MYTPDSGRESLQRCAIRGGGGAAGVSQFLFAEGIGYRAEIELFSGLAALCFKTAELARPERFELPTYSSGGCRSIQLSYGRAPSSLHWDARRAQES